MGSERMERATLAAMINVEPPRQFECDDHAPQPKPPEPLGYGWSCNGNRPGFREDDPRYQEVLVYRKADEEYHRLRDAWIVRQEIVRLAAYRVAVADAILAALSALDGGKGVTRD